MSLHDAMASVVSERAESKGDKKHYIPFSTAEFETLRAAFKRPGLMPNDIKLILLAMAEASLISWPSRSKNRPAHSYNGPGFSLFYGLLAIGVFAGGYCIKIHTYV